ncbi:hypothetical protein [Massilia genomosp. 1]|uniref:RES domain-containing protein n=1 Tax=Massilia genomosp. 1 TaxID=2609280 RepID=A0ABX0MYK0_9BURK|nr:hypothetical protein [Massilia genomosp. 1]NHZ67062.1 hypothetical protein [Massilia genomosp. 1]
MFTIARLQRSGLNSYKIHYEKFMETGVLHATGETSTSPAIWYASKYAVNEAEEVLVKFALKPGTMEKLLDIGIASEAGTKQLFSKLPMTPSGKAKWGENHARIKFEQYQVTTALGSQNGKAVKIFSENIVQHEPTPLNFDGLIHKANAHKFKMHED